jgi:hypothetical protein
VGDLVNNREFTYISINRKEQILIAIRSEKGKEKMYFFFALYLVRVLFVETVLYQLIGK